MSQSIPKYNGVIAIIDILGFGEYVETHPIDEVLEGYTDIISYATLGKEFSLGGIEIMAYSDTIAIRLVDQSDNGFSNFILFLQLIINEYFKRLDKAYNLPIRGAISVGEYLWHIGGLSTRINADKYIFAENTNLIVGKAIIDAHKFETAQKWIGISMNKNTAKKLNEMYPAAFNELLNNKSLIEYNIPLEKYKDNEKGYVVNPPIRFFFKETFEAFLLLCENIFNNNELKQDIKFKYYNTLKFLFYLYSTGLLFPYYGKTNSVIDLNKYNEVIQLYKNIEINKSL